MKESVFFSLTVLLIMLPTAVAVAQSTTANQLQAALDEWRESFEIPGTVLAIDTPDRETLILVSGVSDIEAGGATGLIRSLSHRKYYQQDFR